MRLFSVCRVSGYPICLGCGLPGVGGIVGVGAGCVSAVGVGTGRAGAGVTGVTGEGDCPWVWLVNVNHLYWVRDGLQVAAQKIHPHGHGWSIANNVDAWSWA